MSEIQRHKTLQLLHLLFHQNNSVMLSCCLFNARSVVNKVPELHHILYCENYDMLFITETWLTTEVSSGLLDPQSHYHIIRKDRSGNIGGGVAAFVKRN